MNRSNHYTQLVRICVYAFFLLAAQFWGGASVGIAQNRLIDIRYWSSPTFTRIVLDLKTKAHYDAFSLVKPHRLVVDLKDFDGPAPKKLVKIRDGIVKQVRTSRKDPKTVRIVIDLAKKSNHKIFPLKKISTKPPRLVIDIRRPDLEKADRAAREQTRKLKQTQGDVVVVIDPGHGGEDPGTVSKQGTREKDIVFAIAKKTVAKLNRKKGLKAYLTRKGDYFIPLRRRIEIAKQYGADVFVSIHVDSSFSSKVYGSSVYCLSFKGASSNAAKMAARKENASDFIGGVPLDHYNRDLNAIIVDLVQTHNLNSSLRLAGLMLKEIAKINRLHTKKPHQADFAVLKAPDIPSVLIETDFMSNPRREKRMKTAWFQNEYANRITAALTRFLAGRTPPVQQYYAQSGLILHTIKRGETLSHIAQQYNTTVSRLRTLNNLSSKSIIRYGQKLRVKPGKAAKRTKPAPTYHIVKKGESLSSIAQQYNTTVSRLRTLNNLSSKNIIRYGQKLRVKPAKTAKRTRPSPTYHIVKKGESLSSIAQKYNTTVSRLRTLNNLSSKNIIRYGQKLRVL